MKRIEKILPKTLRAKLQIALFAIGFLPFLVMLVYIHNLGEKRLLDNALETYHIQIHETRQRIGEELLSLGKEIHFLASLDIMDDMIVGDVDKRIRQILLQKEKDLSLDMQILALDTEGKVIASTADTAINGASMIDSIREAKEHDKSYFMTKKHIVMFAPVRSKLKEGTLLGYLCMAYSFSNLQRFTVNGKGGRSMLYDPVGGVKIGQIYDDRLLSHIAEEGKDYVGESYLVLHEKLQGMLSQWILVYTVPKAVALTFLDTFLLFLWGLFILGIFVIAILSLWVSRRILEPIATLSQATQSIISTRDYTTQVAIASEGEIGELAHDFNVLISETNRAFGVLEEENRLRVLRFVQLIDMLNHLIKTEKEEECIRVAIEELQTFMPHQTFSFSTEYPKESTGEDDLRHTMLLYTKDFDRRTESFYGVIYSNSEREGNDPYEAEFYRSIATMIMLQLDHIRLIEQTREVSRAKSTFISLMSHELRTPLHTILSSAQYLIGYETLSPTQQEKVATMESSAHHLLGMINDILDLAQIEAGKVQANPEAQSSEEIEVLVAGIVDMLGVLAEQKGIEMTFENRLPEPVQLIADTRLLKQIVINLLSNAIKFTEEGSIALSLQACGEDICIEIADSGIGIDAEDLERLFEDFTQVNRLADREEKGNGLGLVISRKLAQLFDADVMLRSGGEGLGTTAVIRLKKS